MRGSKKILILALVAIIMHIENVYSQGVHYDFDSLLEHNFQFKPLLSMVMDTLKIFGPDEPLEFTVSTDMRALSNCLK